GRRYTIGGHAGIQKNLNNEYNFFEDNNLPSPHDSIKTYNFDAIDSSEISSSFTKMDLIKTNDVLEDSSANKINTGTIFNENIIMNSCESSNLNTTKCLSKNVSVQKLFKYYKTCSQNLEHEQRVCKPCAHVYNGSTCMNGDDCLFCHHPDHVLISAKKWKKLVKNNMEKLNILLHMLRNPDDVNAKLLNEMVKQNSTNFKKSKKTSNNNKHIINLDSCNNSVNISNVTNVTNMTNMTNITNDVNCMSGLSNLSNLKNPNNMSNFTNMGNFSNMGNFNSVSNTGGAISNRRNRNNKNKTYYFSQRNVDNIIRFSHNNYDSNETADTFKSKLNIRNNDTDTERDSSFLPYHVNL
ncbi:conserved Plasmodium protein, unknown function, partial [Plasmodium ovale curtisi]